ncbi:ABC transporter ATP-binding protein [Paracraurococcus ruber]|uniref:ABC transporter ATP-binding protein n=1 Tax=Paracraurococcus ruber TaxID=77675 RepID=A0ABS1CSA4_9PROT|nr:ABC transporter ATP-binding protein [Paracraurococcus ruber]MBK1657265.1 ABC transporter ATP-binding protein [Paracraurococcus ruber]TDG33153.1 ABC transporter ATP-binding protein [Paracraurococcus ruber]
MRPGGEETPALLLQGVGRRFGALAAVSDVSLAVARGERRAVLGPNGAGKTTLFNLICGDFPPTAGRVLLFGEDITALRPHHRARRGVGRTYQTSLLFNGLSVRDNLLVALRGARPGRFSWRLPPTADRAAAQLLAERVRIAALLDTPVAALSHGQRRQLEVGMALACEPRLLMLDEPAAGLSPVERPELVALLRSLPRDLTLIVIEHDMDIALPIADLVTVMKDGQVVVEGPPDRIESDPMVQAIYLGHGRSH